jgi:hypothetical protein
MSQNAQLPAYSDPALPIVPEVPGAIVALVRRAV